MFLLVSIFLQQWYFVAWYGGTEIHVDYFHLDLKLEFLLFKGKHSNWQAKSYKVTVAYPECFSSLYQVLVLCWILHKSRGNFKRSPDTWTAYSFDSYIWTNWWHCDRVTLCTITAHRTKSSCKTANPFSAWGMIQQNNVEETMHIVSTLVNWYNLWILGCFKHFMTWSCNHMMRHP